MCVMRIDSPSKQRRFMGRTGIDPDIYFVLGFGRQAYRGTPPPLRRVKFDLWEHCG